MCISNCCAISCCFKGITSCRYTTFFVELQEVQKTTSPTSISLTNFPIIISASFSINSCSISKIVVVFEKTGAKIQKYYLKKCLTPYPFYFSFRKAIS